jgi:phosphoribosylglycinamide formyltransferase-1
MNSAAKTGTIPFPAINERPVRLAVCISGGGTTLLNFLAQIKDQRLNAEIPLVVASKSSAGVQRARAAGLECSVIRPRDYSDVAAYSDEVFNAIRSCQADVVALAGFLSLLRIPDDFHYRVLNIHPSLIPAFSGHGYYGHHVHQAAIDRGVKVSGCTVHFADNEYDQGPIILQRTVMVPDDCDAEQLASLVFEQEQVAYPEAIRLLAAGRIEVAERRTRILSESP